MIKKKRQTKVKIYTTRNLTDFDQEKVRLNEKKYSLSKGMVVGNFDKCVGTWAKRVREGKAILGLDQEAVLRLEYF